MFQIGELVVDQAQHLVRLFQFLLDVGMMGDAPSRGSVPGRPVIEGERPGGHDERLGRARGQYD